MIGMNPNRNIRGRMPGGAPCACQETCLSFAIKLAEPDLPEQLSDASAAANEPRILQVCDNAVSIGSGTSSRALRNWYEVTPVGPKPR